MIYLAGPLFSAAERLFNTELAKLLAQEIDEQIFLPQSECSDSAEAGEIFKTCTGGIEKSRLVVAILDGPDSDSGTCFEVGYAHALEKPVVGIRTDFRQCGDDGGLNLMLSQSCSSICHVSSLVSGNSTMEIVRQVAAIIRKLDG